MAPEKTDKLESIEQDKVPVLVFGGLNDFENLSIVRQSLDIELSNQPAQFKNSTSDRKNFVIDTTNIARIRYRENYYYTMRIIRKDKKCTTCFQNLVISDLDSKEPEAYIFTYKPDYGFFTEDSHIGYPFEGEVTVRRVAFKKLNLNKYKGSVCVSITYLLCDYGGEEHAAGPNCTQTYTVGENLCIYTNPTGGGTVGVKTYSNNYYDSGHYNNTDGESGQGKYDPSIGPGHTNGPDLDQIDPDDPITLPLIGGPVLYASGLDYHLGLTTAEFDWALENSNEAAKIMLFMQNDDFSEESKDFANAAIEALMDERFVNFNEAYISVATSDDNYDYQGPTALIPSTLTLNNGDNVNIEFGVTGSDGISANQEVATHLIAGLEFALNEANNNLPVADKITKIYIMATTNGDHSEGSNHYSGTAMDISRINGMKMAISGITNQIIELQEAFDNYQFIRENFGPYFKHKYSIESDSWNYNHSVGGHKSHIHISTRTN